MTGQRASVPNSRYTREIHTPADHSAICVDAGQPFRYPGGKGASGVAQTIINTIPPHQTYIEAFVGGGAVFRAKSPAASSILIDRDRSVIDEWKRRCSTRPDVTILEGDSLELVPSLVAMAPGDAFAYFDPPYLHATRSRLDLYRCELSDAEHAKLLELLASLPCKWALSGYRHPMYDDAAAASGWNRIDYQAMTRRGQVTESLWLNFTPSADIAEFTYAGSSFRERERIKRKVQRWSTKFGKLQPIERRAILAALTMADRHE